MNRIGSSVRRYNKGNIRPFMRKHLLKYFPASSLIRYDMFDRPYYAYGLLVAFEEAKKLGHFQITVIELGVGDGGGFLNLCKTVAALTKEYGINVNIVGFDTGIGVPVSQGYKDHPEIWSTGQFVHDKKSLTTQLPTNAKIIYGDVQKTVPQFIESLQEDEPISFVSLDLDYYSSTKNSLPIFLGATKKYLPSVMIYVDDIEELLTYNSYCGAMLAINEFNQENEYRKIERKATRVNRKPQYWHQKIYCCHILDHPVRSLATAVLGGNNEIKMSSY